MTSTCLLFSPVAIIVASKFYSKYYLLTVRGEPTRTACPTTQQKFHKNKQAGGWAYIPQQHMAFVLERLRATLHECENRDEMSIDMLPE